MTTRDDEITASGVSRETRPRRIPLRSIAMCSMAVLAIAMAGCSSSKDNTSTTSAPPTTAASTSSSYPAGKEQLCAARDQLKSSVTALTKPSLLAGGAAAIKPAVDKVQTDADAVKAAAQQANQPAVNVLQTSVQDLRTAVGNVGNGSVSKDLQTVATDIAKVGTAAEALFTQLKTTCGS